jgi:three-Cys-motif partner protein
MAAISIECLLILNDEIRDTIELLKTNVAPLEAAIKAQVSHLHLKVEYFNEPFEKAYPEIGVMLKRGRYSNSVLFNLDQCGHKHVAVTTLQHIMRSYASAEIFYTFAIQSLIVFLEKANPAKFAAQLLQLGLSQNDLLSLQGAMNREAWLAAAEKIVFEHFGNCAPYVSPFSIHNPSGWRYWLIHFANSYRARQVYNNVLHQNSSSQAHFGRSGLNMLSFNPSHHDGRLYLFDAPGREIARSQLLGDIPRLIAESGDAMGVGDFYGAIYNKTPAHTDDVHAAIIENPDIEVITPAGGERRKANTISVHDVLKLKGQKSFYPMFFDADETRKS